MNEATAEGPVFKVLQGPSATQKGVGDAVTTGLSSVVSAGSNAVELFAHDQDGLLTMLHRKVATAKDARKRSRWFGGRFYNRCAGDDPDYVPLSGTHLRQAMSAAGIEAPDFVVAAGRYALRFDIAATALAALDAARDDAAQT